MPGLTDSHAHLFSEEFADDLLSVLDRARQAGVTRIVIPATGEETARQAIALAAAHPWLFAAVGIHPHEAGRVGDGEIGVVHALASTTGVVAIGEIGLDYFYDFAPRDVQVGLFRRQLSWAVERDLPVIVHTRDSMDEAVDIAIEVAEGAPQWRVTDGVAHRGVFHCFTGTEDHARRLFSAGYYVSFPGIVTFKKSPVGALIPRLGLDRVMIETDAPYLTPVPHRGKRNEPAYVSLVANAIAALLGITPEEVAHRTSANADAVFRFPSTQSAT
ncbi:MAG: TatD family hydrolase [Bacteroidetes bacterium]|jgi:TatD DNase family protein|nr:TatD family hydrolase [Bacteroidota bacterium]